MREERGSVGSRGIKNKQPLFHDKSVIEKNGIFWNDDRHLSVEEGSHDLGVLSTRPMNGSLKL